MSNTPTSSAQVAEGMNLEAERAAPTLAHCPFCGGESVTDFIDDLSYIIECNDCACRTSCCDSKEEAIAAWNRRTAAPVAEGVALPPLDAEGFPPLPRPDIPVGELILDPIDEPYYSKRTVEQVRNTVIAPYAERIRHLERELATFKGEHATQLATIESREFRKLLDAWGSAAWGEYDDGDVRQAYAALIAYIDGRTAGPAVPEGYVIVPLAPTDDMTVAFAEQWYSKVRCIDDCELEDCYAAMIAAAPNPQEDA